MGDTNCTNTRSQCTNSLQAWNYNGMCMNIRSTSFLHTPNTSDNWLHYLRRWGRSRYLCRATGSFVSLRRRRPCPLLCFALLCFALRIHILVSLFKSFDVHVIISVSISSCTTEGHQRLPIQHGSLHSKTRRTRHAPPHFQGTSSVQGLLVALLRRCCRFCECLNCGRRFYRCLCGAIRRRSAADTFPSVHTNAARAAAPAGRVAVGRPVAVVRLRRRRRGCAAAAAPERAVPRRGRPAAGRGRRPPAGPGHAAGVRGRGAVVHVAGGGGAARAKPAALAAEPRPSHPQPLRPPGAAFAGGGVGHARAACSAGAPRHAHGQLRVRPPARHRPRVGLRGRQPLPVAIRRGVRAAITLRRASLSLLPSSAHAGSLVRPRSDPAPLETTFGADYILTVSLLQPRAGARASHETPQLSMEDARLTRHPPQACFSRT